MVQTYTTTGTNIQVQGLQPSTTYYFTVTAYNQTTPGDSSSVQSQATQTGGSAQAVLYSGKLYLQSGKLIVTSGSGSSTQASQIINSSGGNILMSDGSTLTIG